MSSVSFQFNPSASNFDFEIPSASLGLNPMAQEFTPPVIVPQKVALPVSVPVKKAQDMMHFIKMTYDSDDDSSDDENQSSPVSAFNPSAKEFVPAIKSRSLNPAAAEFAPPKPNLQQNRAQAAQQKKIQTMMRLKAQAAQKNKAQNMMRLIHLAYDSSDDDSDDDCEAPASVSVQPARPKKWGARPQAGVSANTDEFPALSAIRRPPGLRVPKSKAHLCLRSPHKRTAAKVDSPNKEDADSTIYDSSGGEALTEESETDSGTDSS